MQHLPTIKHLLCLLFLFIVLNGSAQVYLKARTITTADGLSDKNVTCFYKDRKGFIWVGTRNGLNRYDGHSFKVFQPAAGNSISNEVVNCIAEDSRGRIWVGTMKGLNIYDPAMGNWEVMMPDPDKRRSGVPNFIIWDIAIDQQDRVWIASDVFEFCSYAIPTKKFTFYDWPLFARNHPVLNKNRYRSIRKFVKKNEHEFWLASNIGLISLDIRTGEFQYIGGAYRAEVTDLLYHAAWGKVYLTAQGGNYYCFDERQNQFQKINPRQEPYPSTHFTYTAEAQTWIASEKGLIKISNEGNDISLETNLPGLSASLLPGGVNAVLEDNRQMRWVGTANGISLYDPSGSRSSFLPLVPASDKESINRVGGVYYDTVSGIYFVCMLDPPGLFIIKPSTGQIKKVTTDANGNGFTSCNSIKRDRHNTLWLLTLTHVYRYDRAKESFSVFPIPNVRKDVLFRDMLQDEEDNYWFATFNEGIYYYKTTEKKFETLPDSSISHLYSSTGFAADTANHMILGSTFGEGVFSYHLPTEHATGYYETATTADYSQLNLVNGITTDAKGGIWMAAYSGGVFRYNSGSTYDKSFTRYDMRNGLTSNNIISACSDDDTTLWMLTGKGLSSMSIYGRFLGDLEAENTFGFSSYTSDSRYPHDIFYNPFKKELLVGAGGGLFFYSTHPKATSLNFPLVITGARVNGKVLTENELHNSSVFQLPYHSNTVVVNFAGLYYGTLPGIHYQYRLQGFDNDWIEAGKDYTAVYQNLPSGSYRFTARALTPDGAVAGEISGLSVEVKPPFWRAWWFVLLILLLMAAVIWWIIHSLQTKLKVERISNAFATSLYGQNTTEDILWDTAKNCIEKLGFIDCVIYQRNEQRNVLWQTAAYGPKNPQRREILNKIEIPVGRGIVGWVAQHGRGVIVRNTAADDRYIVDDEKRLSEIAVPVLVDGKVFAVIDSEHPQKKFYSKYHLRVLTKIAGICAERVSKYLNEERLRAKIARDLHDEMGSTLTSINIISKVAMEEKQEPGKLNDYFSKIKDHSGRMMESMSDMVWAINPVNDNFEKVILKMKEFVAEMLEPARINYRVAEQGPLEQTHLNPEQRRDIYMILKEAVNNIVKYSSASEVLISLKREEKHLQLQITDNGKGFDIKAERTGNGLRNMRSRAEEMGAVLKVETAMGKGTAVLLDMYDV